MQTAVSALMLNDVEELGLLITTWFSALNTLFPVLTLSCRRGESVVGDISHFCKDWFTYTFTEVKLEYFDMDITTCA